MCRVEDRAACGLPGHGVGDAWIDLEDSLGPRYFCTCHGRRIGDERTWFHRSVVDAYWARRSGTETDRHRPGRLSARRRWEWRLLLCHELGLVQPEPLDLDPSAIDGTDLDVAEFWRLWWGLHQAADPRPSITFTGQFVADVLGIPKRTAGAAITRLAKRGVIVRVGALPPLGGRSEGAFLYAPGPSKVIDLNARRARRSR